MRASFSTDSGHAKRHSGFGAERLVRRQKIAVWSVILIVLCAVTSFSSGYRVGGYGGASIPSAVRSATTPPSSYDSGLIHRPDPIDPSSDLAMTGNVAGGKHFQGGLPYRSPTSVDVPLGSTSLDSFLRRTTPAATSGNAGAISSPYYSATGTVAGGGLRRSFESTYDVESPVSPSGTGSGLRLAPNDMPPSNIPTAAPPTSGTDASVGWPTAMPNDSPVTREDYDRQMSDLQQRLAQVKAELAELERSFAPGQEHPATTEPTLRSERSVAPERFTENRPAMHAAEASRRQALLEETARLLSAAAGLPSGIAPEYPSGPAGIDVDAVGTTRPRLQLYEEQYGEDATPSGPASIDDLVSPRTSRASVSDLPLNPNELPSVQRVRETSRAFGGSQALPSLPPLKPLPANPAPAPSSGGEELPSGYQVLGGDRDARMSPVEAATRRQGAAQTTNPSTAGSIQDVGSPSAQGFERYYRAGQQLLQQRSYERAAEAFTLASAYRPGDARAYLGKGQVLLGAGNYLHSAQFIGKAVELDLSLALQKVDLVELTGGADAFVVHFNELMRLVQTQESAQLQFLMAYIYYQMDRRQEAQAAIRAAQRLLPSSVPIDLLRSAICR